VSFLLCLCCILNKFDISHDKSSGFLSGFRLPSVFGTTLLVDNKITFCTHLAQLGLPAFPPHFGQTCHHSGVLMKKLFDYETYKKAHIFGPEIGMQWS